jgi:hypothetical protein
MHAEIPIGCGAERDEDEVRVLCDDLSCRQPELVLVRLVCDVLRGICRLAFEIRDCVNCANRHICDWAMNIEVQRHLDVRPHQRLGAGRVGDLKTSKICCRLYDQ